VLEGKVLDDVLILNVGCGIEGLASPIRSLLGLEEWYRRTFFCAVENGGYELCDDILQQQFKI